MSPIAFSLFVVLSAQPNIDIAERASLDTLAEGAPKSNVPFQVAIAGSAPFVLEGATPTGFSVAVATNLAQRLGKTNVKLTRYPTVKSALEAVRQGKVDMAAGPISITSARAQTVKFSLPYFSANLGIATRSAPQSFYQKIKPFVSKGFLISFVTFLIALLVVGFLIWGVENRKNREQFPKEPISGIMNGMWFALVTMTTVGYGDKAPVTHIGRFIAGVWMIIAMIAASSLTASISTALTLSSLDNVSIHDITELKGHVVSVIPETPGETIARENRAGVRAEVDWHKAVKLVADKEVDAFLYDYPVLKHYVDEKKMKDITVVRSSVKSDDYGMVLPIGSPLTKRVDVELLRMSETRVISTLASKWLGN